MDVGPTATKKQLLEHLLEQGMVLVALDARAEGVRIPDHLGHDTQLRLNLSYRFGLPMEISDWGVDATLTFSGRQCICKIPWEAVFLMVSHATGQPYLFPEDVPQELVAQAEAQMHAQQPELDQQSEGGSTPNGEDAAAPGLSAVPKLEPAKLLSPPRTLAKRPQLRLVSPEDEKANGASKDSRNGGIRAERDPDPEPPTPPPQRRRHLRLVK